MTTAVKQHSDNDFKIEPAQAEDAATIEKIYTAMSQEVNMEAEELAAILNMINNDDRFYVIVAKVEGQVVGFATNEYAWGKLHLLDIAVEKLWRGRGIASRMITHLIEYATEKKLLEVYLEVGANNQAALRLYKKLGFEERLFTRIVPGGLYGLYYPTVEESEYQYSADASDGLANPSDKSGAICVG